MQFPKGAVFFAGMLLLPFLYANVQGQARFAPRKQAARIKAPKALKLKHPVQQVPAVQPQAEQVPMLPYNYTQVKAKVFAKAAVSCAHPLASEVGANILRAGGNAFDAAIAVQLALAVVYPGAGNIGGGGFLVARKPSGQTLTLDFRETAPKAASHNMYLDAEGNPVKGASELGALAGGVPGTVAGLFAALPHAKLPFKTLIQPAIELAAGGYTLTEREAVKLNESREAFLKYSSARPALVSDSLWKPGDTLRQPELAKTLTLIRDKGAAGFYQGLTAKHIIAEMKKGGGIITLQDLKNYKPVIREALVFEQKLQGNKYTIIGMPPPSSGGLLVMQLMKMVYGRKLAGYGFQSGQSTHLMVEAERRAYADRAAHMGDPAFWKVPLKTLTSDAYIKERMADFDPAKATPSSRVKAGQIPESEQTTHISILDAEGNMVSVTTTLNGNYGSKCVIAGAGFLLNNEMDDFSIKPGVPNMYGAVGGEANAIQPGKRMLSSMAPTLVLKNEKPYIVCGTPGGTTIPTSVFQTLVNLLYFNMSAADAVNKPKFHHQWLPDEIAVEPGIAPVLRDKLTALGHTLKERPAIGRTEVIRVLPNGSLESVADIRGDDSVAGY